MFSGVKKKESKIKVIIFLNFKYVFMLNLLIMMMIIIMNIMTVVGATICIFFLIYCHYYYSMRWFAFCPGGFALRATPPRRHRQVLKHLHPISVINGAGSCFKWKQPDSFRLVRAFVGLWISGFFLDSFLAMSWKQAVPRSSLSP